eukprot:502656-Amphidinium_carterae.1
MLSSVICFRGSLDARCRMCNHCNATAHARLAQSFGRAVCKGEARVGACNSAAGLFLSMCSA